MDSTMRIYGTGATTRDEKRSGRVDGTVILDMRGWITHMLTSMVFSILAQEVVSTLLIVSTA